MSALLEQAFRLAAGELGMASAAWLFVRESAASGGATAVAQLRDALGRNWPVLDAVCAGWQGGCQAPAIDPQPLLPTLQGVRQLLLVGYEADWVDALLAALPDPGLRIGLVTAGDPLADWSRMLDNHAGRIEAVDPAAFQTWAGPRSVLLSFVYGRSAQQLFVLPAWLRIAGSDVRLQFRELLGWHILAVPLLLYPRWLVATEAETFTAVPEVAA